MSEVIYGVYSIADFEDTELELNDESDAIHYVNPREISNLTLLCTEARMSPAIPRLTRMSELLEKYSELEDDRLVWHGRRQSTKLYVLLKRVADEVARLRSEVYQVANAVDSLFRGPHLTHSPRDHVVPVILVCKEDTAYRLSVMYRAVSYFKLGPATGDWCEALYENATTNMTTSSYGDNEITADEFREYAERISLELKELLNKADAYISAVTKEILNVG